MAPGKKLHELTQTLALIKQGLENSALSLDEAKYYITTLPILVSLKNYYAYLVIYLQILYLHLLSLRSPDKQ